MALQTLLTAEQLAAYLDGTLTDDENQIIENLISQDPQLQEITQVIDDVDELYTYAVEEEIPLECFANDFTLPEIITDVSYDDFQDDQYDLEDGYDSVNITDDFDSEESMIENLENSFSDDAFLDDTF